MTERSHIEEPIPVERHEFPRNRWAAFTDDELAAISEIIGTHIDARFWAMITEVEAEIKRRT